MPVNYNLLNTDAPQQLGAMFDPAVQAEKQSRLADLAMNRDAKRMQMQQLQQQMQAAPAQAQRSEQLFQQGQEDRSSKMQATQAEQKQKYSKKLDFSIANDLTSGLPIELVKQRAIKQARGFGFTDDEMSQGLEALTSIKDPKARIAHFRDSAKGEFAGSDLGRERLDLMKEKFAWDKQQKPITDAGPRPKVSPGTRVWREGDEWKAELIKGTPQYQKARSQYASDQAAVTGASSTADDLIKKAEKLKTHRGLEGVFGIEGVFPNIPGGEAAGAETLMEELKNTMQLAGFQALRASTGSPGVMTEREWPKMEASIRLLGKATNVKEAQDALDDIKMYAERIKKQAQKGFDDEWQGSQFDTRKPAQDDTWSDL